ncbi:MAG: hypothetical protein FIO02_04045 [Nitrosopumilales archaeon]|nr:hypothetical protein [Nitrosopumilales archaeon]MRN61350.1 hypothetical protein [Nitrosopumilales archaeon]
MSPKKESSLKKFSKVPREMIKNRALLTNEKSQGIHYSASYQHSRNAHETL